MSHFNRTYPASKMKFHILMFACLSETLAITVYYDIKGNENQNTKEIKPVLKDIRLVPINEVEIRPKQSRVVNYQSENIAVSEKTTAPNRNFHSKSRRNRKKSSNKLSRIGQSDSQSDESHKNYMKKMADQLYIAQKHSSLLSDYQKFIINQDPLAKTFVLGQTVHNRNPKPFSRSKQNGRSLSPKVKETPEPVSLTTEKLNRIVVVTPKASTEPEKISLQKDHSAQPSNTKFVTIAPQPITHYVHTPETYHASQPYTFYNLGVTHTPKVEIQIPTNIGFKSYDEPHYYHEEVSQLEDTHVDPKYEFMYKIKDNEKQTHFGHMESQTDKTTYGYYFVHLPDGRLETVKYWADKTGYHAKVDYQGEAKHPPTSTYKIHSHSSLAHHL